MYYKRIKIFILASTILLIVCFLRLIQMQLLPDSSLQDEIARLRDQRGYSKQLKTLRGKILDRCGRILARDEPQFQLHINYRLSRFWDKRVRDARLLRAAQDNDPETAKLKVQKEMRLKVQDLERIIEQCTYFGLQRTDVERRINEINDSTWKLRTFLAWVRNGPDPRILRKYNQNVAAVPPAEAIADFLKKFPDVNQRLLLISKVDDIPEMNKDWPLLELQTDDDVFTAQLEFMDIDGLQIRPEGHRIYPYKSAAAQTIGWVGPAMGRYKELFEGDKFASYLQNEICGKRPGVEYVCEPILRGRRGEVFVDIDGRRIKRAKPCFGEDVQLTLDIKLQESIERFLTNYPHDPNLGQAIAAVVIEVATGDILALVSLPTFDLNNIRYNYARLVNDPAEPLRNRAIYKQYPPGSVIKPVVLVAGLEAGEITPDEIISCPAKPAPKGWPNCWLYNKYHWMGHDDKWPNNARNAVKGSCNIYFSRLADRIKPSVLQQWLFKFGYGRKLLSAPAAFRKTAYARTLRQASGIISSRIPNPGKAISTFEQLAQFPIEPKDRRWFGIGQGTLRVTPLQVANAMAVIARGGLYKTPRLFVEQGEVSTAESIPLSISAKTLEVVRDGMSAVVNEVGGTAYGAFANAHFAEEDVNVYGKTGSTEQPYNAWFAGFAEDSTGKSVSIAVVVEGGQSGAHDAAPLARNIIQLCVNAGYIGEAKASVE